MKVRHTPPGRCFNRAPPEPGEAQRIPRYQPGAPPIVYHLFCPGCARRVVLASGITEANPHEVEELTVTSDGSEKLVKHTVPLLSVALVRACVCGTRWTVRDGVFVISPSS